MKLLLIEDDAGITLALRQALSAFYDVDVAANGKDGFTLATSHTYTAIVLDLNLPDYSGLDICRMIRGRGIRTPIIVVSGETKVIRKITLLDAGANDYMTKPFSLEELKARLRAANRQQGFYMPSKPNHLVVEDLVLDRAEHIVKRADQPIDLRRKEFAMLACLMEHTGRVVTRNMLARYAWSEDETIWTNTVDVHIKYLRDKVDRPYDRQLIKTVHGLGYKIEDSEKHSKAANVNPDQLEATQV